MSPSDLAETYRVLQTYVSWTDEDAQRVASLAPYLTPHFATLVDDFYAAVERDDATRHIVGHDPERLARLKLTLTQWLAELLSGRYDTAYVERRWRVGWVHVEIGLPQFYTCAALSRLRSGLIAILQRTPGLDPATRDATMISLSRLLDLDLAIIENAYQTAFTARLQRNERLAILGQVAGGIAHELRNPLNVIKTSCFYLQHARNLSPEKLSEHYERIERQVTLGDTVITALSNFARMPQPNVHPTALDAILESALAVDPPPPGVAIVRDPEGPLPRVMADHDQVRIAIGNLLRNAYEAMDGHGRLILAVDQEGDSVRLRVTDSGPGVPPETIAHIMEPLYSTRARGLGLGLAIARSIVDRHQGRLEVVSPPGQGATFAVTLPAAGD